MEHQKFSQKHEAGKLYPLELIKRGRAGTGYFRHPSGFSFWAGFGDILADGAGGYEAEGAILQKLCDAECLRRKLYNERNQLWGRKEASPAPQRCGRQTAGRDLMNALAAKAAKPMPGASRPGPRPDDDPKGDKLAEREVERTRELIKKITPNSQPPAAKAGEPKGKGDLLKAFWAEKRRRRDHDR